MSNAIPGVGAKLFRWNTSTLDWDSIAEIRSIGGPGMTRDFIDVTNLDSTDGYRQYIPGFRDGGSIPLNMNFTRSTFDTMKTDFEDNDAQNYEIVVVDSASTSFEFEGYVTELSLNIDTDNQVTADVTIKVNGEITVNSGSGSGA